MSSGKKKGLGRGFLRYLAMKNQKIKYQKN
jgi:hypothetical protein